MTTKVVKPMLDPAAQQGLPTTTKGDLVVHDGSANQRLPVGSTGQVLTADSTQALGVKWSNPSAAWDVGDLKLTSRAAPPPLWLACNGQAVSRTTYAALFAVLSTSFGAGDGSTTFNLPDMQGRVPLAAGTSVVNWAISGVDTALDQITVPSNDSLYTGQAIVYTSSATAIGGLTSGNTYYVIRVSASVVKLATTRALAIAGTPINLTTVGSGTQNLVQTGTARALGNRGGEERHSLTIAEIPAHNHPGVNLAGGSGNGNDPPWSGGVTGDAGGSGDHNVMPPYLVAGIWIIYAGV